MRSKRTIFHLLFFLLASTPLLAQEEQDEIPADLPEGTVFNDSLEVVEDSTQLQVGIVDTKIHLLSRTYGDSIVLRWAPEDYATWRYVNRVGMDVLRYSEEHPFEADTLASRLRPLTLEQFRQRYPTTDTLAMMAAGLLYDENRTRPTATKNPPGTLGSLHEIYQEQQMRFGLALMTTEWRRDLAEALAMRLVDRTAKRGKTYEYIVRPSEIDTSGQIIVRTGHIPEVKNERYKPEPFVTTLTDTTIAENTVQLTWNRGKYSTFEIERRPALDHSRQRREASGAWERVNDKPYIDMSPNELGEADSLYTMTDQVPQLGRYEYRLQAHDVFGDLTEPTKPFRVWVRDITPPSAPTITLITIDRRDSTDLSKGVFATFHLRKDTIEADYLGWHLVYYHERETSRQWRRLSQQMSAADSLLTLDVTGFSTGMVAVAATDTAGNVGYSIPQLLRIEDLKAPGVPTNLRAEGNAEEGTITLTWDAPEEADIDYYEVAYANDTTHRWVLATETKLQDTRFVDSVDVTVNQKYIYYKVRAIDYSTNQGEYSQVLPVIRHITDRPEYNREQRYQYAIESLNYSGISSGMSLAVSLRWEGEAVFSHPLKLFGEYLPEKQETHLAWEMDGEPPYPGKWYFCIFRQGPGDDAPRFLLSAAKEDRSFTDHLLREGESAQYYIRIKYADGRQSEDSNMVRVSSE